MERDLTIMQAIQAEKAKELEAQALQPLNGEGVKMAEGKRFTLDVVDVPTDPLR